MNRRFVFASLIAIAICATVIATWWFRSRSRDTPLEPGWDAVVSAIAGDGVAGWRDGDNARARFSDPFGVAVGADGTIYVSDAGDAQRIRGILKDGRTFTVAGSIGGFADGAGSAARFDTPSGLAIDSRNTIYVADTGNNAIRRITPAGEVSTLAGDGIAGYQDGPGQQARFNGPVGIAVDPTGRIIVADAYNDRIRAIDPDGTVTTLAGGSEPGFADGAGVEARFDTPCGVSIGPGGVIHVADTGNGVVRTIDPSGSVATAGVEILDRLVRPIGIASDPTGTLYVTDDRGRVIEMASASGRTIAGSSPGFRDGAGHEARFRRPAGIALAAPGRLIVADAGNALVRLVSARSTFELRPPPSPFIAPAFDADAFARWPLLWPVAPMDGPHEIAGTIGEARGGEGSERFHAGIDIRAEQGTPVLAMRDGVVSHPVSTDDFGSLNEWLRIGPIAYIHVRAGRSRGGDVFDSRFVPTHDEKGRVTRVRVKRGARFATGDAIASVNAFNHVHLNVGWPGEEQNPLRFRLVQFEDTVPPTIARGGIRLYDESWQPLTKRARGRVLVSGRVHVVVDGWDRADGNKPTRRLGLYEVGYQVLNRDGSAATGFDAVHEAIRFDGLTGDPDAPKIVYAPGSGIPFYGRRVTRFLYVVTNTFRDGVASEGFWDTSVLPAGDYTVRIRALDIARNEAIANRDLPVTIVAPVGQEEGRKE